MSRTGHYHMCSLSKRWRWDARRKIRVETARLHGGGLPEPFSLALVPLTLRWYTCHQRKQCRKASVCVFMSFCVCVCVYSLRVVLSEWLYELIGFSEVPFTVVPMLIHCCCQLGIDLSFQSSKIKAISGRGSSALIVSFMISNFITQQFSVSFYVLAEWKLPIKKSPSHCSLEMLGITVQINPQVSAVV